MIEIVSPAAPQRRQFLRRAIRKSQRRLLDEQGLLIATEGNTTDFKFIEAEILELAARFVVTELAYDRTFADEIVRNLQDEGLSLVEFGQGFLSMGPASAEFLRLLIGRDLQHGGNPIATWCASVCRVNSLLSRKKQGISRKSLAFVSRIGANLIVNSGCYRKIPCATEQGMVFARTGKSDGRTGNILPQSGNRPCPKERIGDPAADRSPSVGMAARQERSGRRA